MFSQAYVKSSRVLVATAKGAQPSTGVRARPAEIVRGIRTPHVALTEVTYKGSFRPPSGILKESRTCFEVAWPVVAAVSPRLVQPCAFAPNRPWPIQPKTGGTPRFAF